MIEFDIPIALIFFNRPHTLQLVFDAVRRIRPAKLYLIADGARAEREGEAKNVGACREFVRGAVDWPCNVRMNYSAVNKGCFDRIVGGASWVFETEKWAIFLEDDNVPEGTFFPYCREMLHQYEDDDRILSIAGTNYLVDYRSPGGSDILFSRGMYPCGWASWRNRWALYPKFAALWEDESLRKRVLHSIKNRTYRRYKESAWRRVHRQLGMGKQPYTWDHQWHFVQYALDRVCVVPRYNQIRNIGVGPEATHGGTRMTRHLTRLLALRTLSMRFPLSVPEDVHVDLAYDRKVMRLITGVPILHRAHQKLRRLLSAKP